MNSISFDKNKFFIYYYNTSIQNYINIHYAVYIEHRSILKHVTFKYNHYYTIVFIRVGGCIITKLIIIVV